MVLEKWTCDTVPIDHMELEKLPYNLTVCKMADTKDFDLSREFFFLEKTDEELSLVCRTEDVPEHALEREDGWKGIRIKGVLDFSLVGILSKITKILAENRIGIFAVSTYNTDYILVKSEEFDRAITVLESGGYSIV